MFWIRVAVVATRAAAMVLLALAVLFAVYLGRAPVVASYEHATHTREALPELRAEVMQKIITPTVRQLADEGTPYSGVLYAGLMLTETGPKLIEYNCRFGDPECQVLMMRYRGDLAALMLACATGKLAGLEAGAFDPAYALTVVMAANGYPGTPEKGGAIAGLDSVTDAKVFHAGTAVKDGQLTATGGRVLNITARGDSLKEARDRAYDMVGEIDWREGFCRKDIGWRAL